MKQQTKKISIQNSLIETVRELLQEVPNGAENICAIIDSSHYHNPDSRQIEVDGQIISTVYDSNPQDDTDTVWIEYTFGDLE